MKRIYPGMYRDLINGHEVELMWIDTREYGYPPAWIFRIDGHHPDDAYRTKREAMIDIETHPDLQKD